MINVRLPAFFQARNPAEGLRCCNAIRESDEDVQLDVSAYRFFDPFGLAVLGASVQLALANGNRVLVRGACDGAGYLARMDVLAGAEWLDGEPTGVRCDRADALVELTRLDNRINVEDAAARLARAVIGREREGVQDEPVDEMTGYTPHDRLVEPIQYVFNELLENALTHARRHGYAESAVWVACQYYPTRDLIRLAVIDDGCGFRRSLESHEDLPKGASDLAAILLGLKPRVSCNRNLRLGIESVNQGVGLTTSLRIAERAGGGAVIVSGDGIHRSRGRNEVLAGGACWHGVAVSLECSRTKLAEVRFRELLPPSNVPRVRLRFE